MNDGKDLNKMSLEELWQLFPIVITQHNPRWKFWADEEISLLHCILNSYSPIINHIGSTAIPSICAKPIIDILVEIAPEANWNSIKDLFLSNGYICMSYSPDRMSFNKGYTSEGYAERVFHIHIRKAGDNDEIYFRDYLKNHPLAAKEYEALKLSLLPEFKNNRDGYTQAKTAFVQKIMKLAR